MDSAYGELFEGRLDFEDNFFDYVTMLAVIEHFHDPLVVLREIRRVLKPSGRFIFTTPKQAGEWIMNLYARHDAADHHTYLDYPAVENLCLGLFRIVGHRTFLLGYNQVFCLEPLGNGTSGKADVPVGLRE